MEDEELADVLKYSSPKELYIVTMQNLLKLIYCPFRAKVLYSVGLLRKGQIVWVSEVKVTTKLKTVFVVEGSAYYYSHFDIINEEWLE